MKELTLKLESLCIFRDLLQDPVLSSLLAFWENPTNSAYAGFAAALYGANGGYLSSYIREICENSENVYVRTVGRGEAAPDHLCDTLLEELDTLRSVAELTPEKLRESLEYQGFLPGFVTEKLALRELYLHRAANIGKFGYGSHY